MTNENFDTQNEKYYQTIKKWAKVDLLASISILIELLLNFILRIIYKYNNFNSFVFFILSAILFVLTIISIIFMIISMFKLYNLKKLISLQKDESDDDSTER